MIYKFVFLVWFIGDFMRYFGIHEIVRALIRNLVKSQMHDYVNYEFKKTFNPLLSQRFF